MYSYFFDIDNTIADTDRFLANILPQGFKDLDRASQIQILDQLLTKETYKNIPILDNNAVSMLKFLISSKYEDDIYFITARENKIFLESKEWLEYHNLWISEDKLIMEAYDKGSMIAKLNTSKFAILFDDDIKQIRSCNIYNNILGCLVGDKT